MFMYAQKSFFVGKCALDLFIHVAGKNYAIIFGHENIPNYNIPMQCIGDSLTERQLTAIYMYVAKGAAIDFSKACQG